MRMAPTIRAAAVVGLMCVPWKVARTQAGDPNAVTALHLQAADLPPATAGYRYTQTVPLEGGVGPYSLDLQGALPGGMTWTVGRTGIVLDGTPSQAGDYPFAVIAGDSTGQRIQLAATLHVSAAISPQSPVNNAVNDSIILHDLVFVGDAATAGSSDALHLRDMVTVFAADPTVSTNDTDFVHLTDAVTVSVAGASTYTNGQGVVSVHETITTSDANSITTPLLITTPSPLPNGSVGALYNVPLTASGGTGTGYFYLLSPGLGSLPSGLSVSNVPGNGTYLSGFPCTAGVYNFPITVSDSASNSATKAFQLTITPGTSQCLGGGGGVGSTPQMIYPGQIPQPKYGDTFAIHPFSTSGMPVICNPSNNTLAGTTGTTNQFLDIYTGYVEFTCSVAGNATYAPATNFVFVQTYKATLTLTPSDVTRGYGQANPPPLPLTFSGFQFGETLASSGLSGGPYGLNPSGYTSTAFGNSPPGSYTITPSTNNFYAANYQVVGMSATLTVTANGPQTIFFNPLPQLQVGQSLHLAAFSSSGLPISYAVAGAGSLSGNVLTVTGSGTISVTASQTGNGFYAAANPVTRSVINP